MSALVFDPGLYMENAILEIADSASWQLRTLLRTSRFLQRQLIQPPEDGSLNLVALKMEPHRLEPAAQFAIDLGEIPIVPKLLSVIVIALQHEVRERCDILSDLYHWL